MENRKHVPTSPEACSRFRRLSASMPSGLGGGGGDSGGGDGGGAAGTPQENPWHSAELLSHSNLHWSYVASARGAPPIRSLDNSLRSAPATEFHESTPAHIPVLGVVTSTYGLSSAQAHIVVPIHPITQAKPTSTRVWDRATCEMSFAQRYNASGGKRALQSNQGEASVLPRSSASALHASETMKWRWMATTSTASYSPGM